MTFFNLGHSVQLHFTIGHFFILIKKALFLSNDKRELSMLLFHFTVATILNIHTQNSQVCWVNS